MFQMLIHPSSGACDYLVHYCVGCIVLTWGVLVLCSGIGCWWCGIRVQAEPLQPALGYHITNNHSRCITPTCLKSAQHSVHNNAPSSRKLLKMDVLTSETCWAVNWHNKASVIKLVYLYSNTSVCILFDMLRPSFLGHREVTNVNWGGYDIHCITSSIYVCDLMMAQKWGPKHVMSN